MTPSGGSAWPTAETNRPALAADAIILVAIDSDASAASGSGGVEYLFELDTGVHSYTLTSGTTTTATTAATTTTTTITGDEDVKSRTFPIRR